MLQTVRFGSIVPFGSIESDELTWNVYETYTCKGPTRVIYINTKNTKLQTLQHIPNTNKKYVVFYIDCTSHVFPFLHFFANFATFVTFANFVILDFWYSYIYIYYTCRSRTRVGLFTTSRPIRSFHSIESVQPFESIECMGEWRGGRKGVALSHYVQLVKKGVEASHDSSGSIGSIVPFGSIDSDELTWNV